MIMVGIVIIIVLLVVILINQTRAEKQRLYLIERGDKFLDRINPGWRTDMVVEEPAQTQKRANKSQAGWALALLGLIAAGTAMFVFLQ